MTADTSRTPLCVQALRADLVGSERFWRRIDVVAETGSTNADLLAAAAGGTDVVGTVLCAEHQFAGHGRNGRRWSGVPRAQILLSAGISTVGVASEAWGWLPLLTGIAVVDTITELTGVQVGLKWPNDVYGGNRKLAGVLAEVAAPLPIVVVGIGLNVSLRADELPDPAATSLSLLCPTAPDRTELTAALLRRLADHLTVWRSGAATGLMDDYRSKSITIGALVRVLLPGGQQIVGTARDVDAQGRLCVDGEGGPRVVSAGDVVHLRPYDGAESG